MGIYSNFRRVVGDLLYRISARDLPPDSGLLKPDTISPPDEPDEAPERPPGQLRGPIEVSGVTGLHRRRRDNGGGAAMPDVDDFDEQLVDDEPGPGISMNMLLLAAAGVAAALLLLRR